MKKNVFGSIGFVFGLAILISACSSPAREIIETQEVESVEDQAADVLQPEALPTVEPAVVVDNQALAEAAITVPEVEEVKATLNIFGSEQGKVVVDGQGMTLYLFTPDGQSESTCNNTCADNWPPLLAEGEPGVGEGLAAELLGTVARQDGSLQATYNGWPLYYFIRDSVAGDLLGQGVNDVWFLVGPKGDAVIGGDAPNY
ncbi:MAG: hypothetical protein E4G99_03465 [Anaerolineales bacterium]|nr:MAG: hypothetical protein E4G99_03465 [Anaerolineales bacterium]